MPRDDYTGKGKYARIATALNTLAKWQNNFGVAPPLLLRRQPGGGVRLGIDPPDLDGSVPGGAMHHPFQLIVDGDGNYEIRGGSVDTGIDVLSASGFSGDYTGDTKHFWLVLTYPNDGDATAVIDSGDTVPSSDHLADDIPVDCDEAPTNSGWAKIVIPLASVGPDQVSQYQHSDLYVPRGKTVSVQRVVALAWDEDNALQQVVVSEVYVNGVLQTVTDPSCQTIFATGECPEPEEE